MCTATATPLARQVATRALRRAGDSAPVTLPTITGLAGGARPRDATPLLVHASPDGAATAATTQSSSSLSPQPSSPRPRPLGPGGGYHTAPQLRQSTTLEPHVESDIGCQDIAVSAANAGAGVTTGPSAISVPCTDVPGGCCGAVPGLSRQPHASARERFSRLSSIGASEAMGGGRDSLGTQEGCREPHNEGTTSTPLPPQSARSMPFCNVRTSKDKSPLRAASSTSAFAVAVTSAAAAPGFRNAAASHSSARTLPTAPRLSLRPHGIMPYSHYGQSQRAKHGRMPPRRISDYSMHPMPPTSTSLMELKSMAASIKAPAPTLRSTLTKPPEAPPASPPDTSAVAASAAPPPPPAAIAVTAVAENAALAATARSSALCSSRSVEPSAPPEDYTGDGTGTGSETTSFTRSGSGRVQALSSGVCDPPTASNTSTCTSTSTFTPMSSTGTSTAVSAEVALSRKGSEGEPQPQLAQQLHAEMPPTPPAVVGQLDSPQGMQQQQEQQQEPLKECSLQESPFARCTPDSPAPSMPTAAASPASPADSWQVPAASPPRQAAGALTAVAAAAATPPPAGAGHLLPPAQSTLGEFVPQRTPGQGLIHFSPEAPLQMLRAPASWAVADYKVVRKLYAGYASSVYKARCLYSGNDVVLKAYNLAGLSTFLRNQVLRELDIHSRLRHPGVVHLLAAFREDETLVLVQEYIRGGSLERVRRKLGGRMSEFQAMHLVLLPLLGVLSHLHEQGIVHRDIKPENLLFTESWQLKLCDFGVSICLREERAVTRTGSREYMAPEVSICPLKHLPEDNKDNLSLAYTSAVDVWSLGSLMYELLVGFTPFPGGPPPRREGARGSAGAALAFPTGVSQAARAFVRDCLQLEPEDRPTVHKLTRHLWTQEALEYKADPSSST
ncbi:aurora like protein kinase [Volvox carteri f. nagariensis]|uniref:Aurora like protein kinase n=1 Tax=Volvox carteri f. nagariensis TaxID=3068 RepID=D8TL60_VOLCA|nr:aurora like protein kinase [Volvox carteri f. nagariensis]EFJ51683.1 aurora like protein kinase [Volvox carteri f. nagariensis]|eukprot:XP_002947093.1 aurora like protein kinase [Volvox carteri f. nagariensis]